jgi:hypothetical protein
MSRQQLITVMILIAVIIFQSNFCLSDDLKQKYSNVRLQQNEWIHIIKQVEEVKYNERAQSDVWYLYVKVMFLQYCKASKKKSRLSEIAEDPNATQQEFAEAFGEQLTHIDDYIVPKLRCNYRTTVFLTTYSADGKELSTMKTVPVAPKDPLCKSCLTEIMPGETIWVTFRIPIIALSDQTPPKSWHVWVPK